ncbi:MAG TPA: hypothetical protein VI731_11355 [Bacteroidia bacterium]|nr:hypothetical protein [Bacteroidia bacterium]
MKSVKTAALFGALSLVFMGCPYESKFPISQASGAKADKSLAGKWEEKGSDTYLWTVTLEDNIYKIVKKSTDDASSEPSVYRGHLSTIGTTTWMNVYEVEESEAEEKKWYIYKVEKKGDSGDMVKLHAMTDNITEEFMDAAELTKFIKENMHLSFFYNKDDKKSFYKADD